jgi:hypothetical protein
MSSKLAATVVALFSLAASAVASAGSFSCRGVPSRMAVAREGGLRFSVGFGVWTVCNVNTDGYSGGVFVTAAACRSWQAQVMTAMATGQEISVIFYSDTLQGVNIPECSNLGHGVSVGVSSLEIWN